MLSIRWWKIWLAWWWINLLNYAKLLHKLTVTQNKQKTNDIFVCTNQETYQYKYTKVSLIINSVHYSLFSVHHKSRWNYICPFPLFVSPNVMTPKKSKIKNQTNQRNKCKKMYKLQKNSRKLIKHNKLKKIKNNNLQ